MKKKSNIHKYFADPKLLIELTRLASLSKKMTGKILTQWKADKEKIYGDLHEPLPYLTFEDANKITPRYIQTMYIYIDGATKEEYEIILN